MKKTFKILLGLIVLLAMAFGVFWFSRPADISFEEHKSRIPFSESSRFAEVNGIKLHYQEKGEGQPLILIHGYAASTYTWKEIFEPLSKKFRVIAVDLKGFGFSDKPDGDYSRGEQAKFIAGLMDHLRIDKAILCGNSMGGEVALNAALQNPGRVSALILIDSAGVRVDGGASIVPFYLQIPYINRALSALALLSTGPVRDGLKKSYYDDSRISDEKVNYYHLPLTGDNGQRAAILARMQFNQGRIEEKLDQISQPALLIWGAEDEVIPIEAGRKMNSLIKGSQLIIYEKCGHVPQEEMPERLSADILGFLEKY